MNKTLTFGSLFAGIGGFDLGLERASMVCKWQVEIDPFCRKVLEKHWPGVPKYEDIREITGNELEPVDLICGGFPCQDISVAGRQDGITGERSGLWKEIIRIVRLVRPRFVLVENVAALLNNGMGVVLGDLAEIGFDAEWECLPAAAFGFPHQRERIFIFAHSPEIRWNLFKNKAPASSCRKRISDFIKSEYRWQRKIRGHSLECVGWSVEPAICGSDDGIPSAMDEIGSLGNAVVPQVVEWIGRQLLKAIGTNASPGTSQIHPEGGEMGCER